MLDLGRWQPASDMEIHLAPIESAFVATTAEASVPAFGDLQAETAKCAQVAGHGMIAINSPQHALQPCALLGNVSSSRHPKQPRHEEVAFCRHHGLGHHMFTLAMPLTDSPTAGEPSSQ